MRTENISSKQLYLFVVNVILATASMYLPAQAQTVTLGPSIGLASVPNVSDEICDIPFYPEIDDELEGLTEGDLIPDFTLYTPDNTPVQASSVLSDGKPALFIGGSYTCWVFRDQVATINYLQDLYADQLHIYIIYTVEAHPDGDISPYYGYVNTGDRNFDEGILYSQPQTYGQRKAVVNDMLDAMEINVPVLIDGPCNEWWSAFGTNPNPAYLIDTNGIIYDAEKWFDRFPENTLGAIEGLFGITIDGEPTPAGEITAEAAEECVHGETGETVVADGSITNIDTIDAYLDIYRIDTELPAGWETSICTDICYPPDVEEASMYVDAGQTLPMHIYFYTTGPDAVGYVTILIRNHYVPANAYTYVFKACTGDAVPVDDSMQYADVFIYPNPAYSIIHIYSYASKRANRQLTMYDYTGKTVYSQTYKLQEGQYDLSVDASMFSAGVYTVVLQVDGATSVSKVIIL
jgi:hypothetical protein